MIGIFPRMARLNHGCSHAFNSVYSWREDEGVLTVHALKDIAVGEVGLRGWPWRRFFGSHGYFTPRNF